MSENILLSLNFVIQIFTILIIGINIGYYKKSIEKSEKLLENYDRELKDINEKLQNLSERILKIETKQNV